MSGDRQIQEIVTRCVSIMVLFHGIERTGRAKDEMIGEVESIVVVMTETDETEQQVLRQVESELIARYGHEVGTRLNSQFCSALDSARSQDVISRPGRSSRVMARRAERRGTIFGHAAAQHVSRELPRYLRPSWVRTTRRSTQTSASLPCDRLTVGPRYSTE